MRPGRLIEIHINHSIFFVSFNPLGKLEFQVLCIIIVSLIEQDTLTVYLPISSMCTKVAFPTIFLDKQIRTYIHFPHQIRFLDKSLFYKIMVIVSQVTFVITYMDTL